MLKILIGLFIGGRYLVIRFKKNINVSKIVIENEMCFLDDFGKRNIRILMILK